VNEPSNDAFDLTKCTDDDIAYIRAAFLDFDIDKSLLDPAKYDAATIEANWLSERERMRGIAADLIASATRPTFVISSGGGCQALWVLGEKVDTTPENRRALDQIEANLLGAYPAADPAVRDVSRILRLPGSVNTKRPDRLRTAIVVDRSGPRYSLDDLLASWPMVALPEAKALGSRSVVRSRDPEVLALVATVTDECPAGLLDRLNGEVGALGRLWRDGEDAVPSDDRSGSRCRWELVKQMRRAGYAFNEALHAARAWPASEGVNPWGAVDLARAWIDVGRRDGSAEGGGVAFEAVDEATASDAEEEDFAAMLDAAFAPADATAAPAEAPRRFKRVKITVDPAKPLDAAAEAARVLREFHADRSDNVVQQAGRLLAMGEFEVISADAAGEPIRRTQRGLIEVSRVHLEQIASERIDWLKATEDGPKASRIPAAVVDALMDPAVAGALGFAPCTGAAEGPLVDITGALRSRAGLDASGLWQLDNHDVDPLPERPTKADSRAALAELEALLAEFPFAGSTTEERALNRTVALAGMMTCVMRPVLDYAPAFLLDAPTPGTGKSELTKVLAAFATSAPLPMAVTSNAEEFDKRLNTMILGRPAVVCFDNVTGILGGDPLNSCLTAEAVQSRVFEKLEERSVPVKFTLLMNGNNVRVRDDMARRAVVCRLDAGMERPETRRFTTDPVRTVRQNRAAYVHRVATIVRAFIYSGAKVDASLSGYERWVAACVAPLVWLGKPNPITSQDALRANDEERQSAGALLATLRDTFGEEWFSAATLAEIAEEVVHTIPRPGSASETDAEAEPDLIDAGPLRAALVALTGGSRNLAVGIGRMLMARRDRPHDGLILRRSVARHREGGWRWRIESAAA
jgi:hypothetical protein